MALVSSVARAELSDTRIAFVSERTGNPDIFVMSPDGTAVVQLTRDTGSDEDPAWSPDGSEIVFASDRSGNFDVYVMASDGSDLRRITSNGADDRHPSWSADGDQILFLSTRDGTQKIYFMKADGSSETLWSESVANDSSPVWSADISKFGFIRTGDMRVVNIGGGTRYDLSHGFFSSAVERDAAWSPNSVQLACASKIGGDFDIYVVTPNSYGNVSDLLRLTDQPSADVEPTWSPDGSAIAFRSDRDGDDELYAMHADGTGVIRLTTSRGPDRSPSWSPRTSPDPPGGLPPNTKVAFTTRLHPATASEALYTVIADGSGKTHIAADGHESAWSPDGTKLAFISYYRIYTQELYVIDVASLEITRLTFGTRGENDTEAGGPTWSPDGRKIAFSSGRDGNIEIYTIDVDGSNMTRLTFSTSANYQPSWTPDGALIAFVFRPVGEYTGVYTMAPDGSNVTRVSPTTQNAEHPAWSPDGKKIAYASTVIWGRDLYVMDADGQNAVRLTSNGWQEYWPTWSPDGRRIAFFTNRIQDRSIYMMHADGSLPRRLTGATWGSRPAWSPFLVPAGPIVFITAPVEALRLKGGTASTSLRVHVDHHSGPWHWRLNSPFPNSGLAGGTPVFEGDSATIAGLEDGQTYTVRVALVGDEGVLLDPPVTTSITFSVDMSQPTHRRNYLVPAGLSIFSPALRPLVLTGQFGTIDTRPTGVLMAHHMINVGATLVVRMVDGLWRPVIGREGSFLFGSDFPMYPDKGYVVNALTPLAFMMEGTPYADEIETPAAPPSHPATVWALGVGGHVTDAGLLPNGTRVRVTNDRTSRYRDVEIATDGSFVGAFGDESQAPLIGVNDSVGFQLVSPSGYTLGPRTTSPLTHDDIRRAYKLMELPGRPDTVRLLPNYPNPFNPETWIPFTLTEEAAVAVRIYDTQGALVRELDLGRRPAGYHLSRETAAHWDGRDTTGEPVASGVYVCEVRAGERRDTRRVLLVK